ncbi:MAG: hypothetical protein BRD38_02850 [Bacteroidetes bacterium QH_9_67_14]|nr:MAG: hypothetical protein BRD38_02850 [Bacteroidetes bacterium QH_9_67_14]
MRSFSGLLLLLVCIGLVVLAVMNPQPDDFQRFVDEQLEARLQTEVRKRAGGDSALGGLIAGTGAGIASRYVDRATSRDNYVVASTYTVDLDGANASELEWKFLGVAGRFVPLETPKPSSKSDSDP